MSALDTLFDSEIPAGRQSLQDSHANLERVADYCEQNYLQAPDKKAALEETKSYTTQSLASVAYQINTLATNMLQMLDLQATQLAQMEASINHISQTVSIHKEKVARREIGVLTTNKNISRTHKIVAPSQAERPIKYVRKPVDYTALDEIGHGVKVTQQQKTPARPPSTASIESSNSSATISTSGTLTRKSAYGTLTKSTPKPPAPPNVPSDYALLNTAVPKPPPPQPPQSQYQPGQGQQSMRVTIGRPQEPPPMPPTSVAPATNIPPPPPPPPPPMPDQADAQSEGGYSTASSRDDDSSGHYMPSMAAMASKIQAQQKVQPQFRGDYMALPGLAAVRPPFAMNQNQVTSPPTPPPPPPPSGDGDASPPLPPPPDEQDGSNMFSYDVDDVPPPPPDFETTDVDEPPWAPMNYIEKVKVIFDYTRDKDDELSLEEGDVVYVVKKNEDGWYEGVSHGLTGLFPGNYVEPLQ